MSEFFVAHVCLLCYNIVSSLAEVAKFVINSYSTALKDHQLSTSYGAVAEISQALFDAEAPTSPLPLRTVHVHTKVLQLWNTMQ
jgi:hypothetical protein